MAEDSSSDDEVSGLQYKIVILGDGAVGKTSICKRLTDDFFAKTYKQTIGIDFFVRKVSLPGDVEVTFQVWDIGGQSVTSNMLAKYVYGAQAIIFVYDITNFETFHNLEEWYDLAQPTFAQESPPYLGVMANKMDLNHLRSVAEEKHAELCEKRKLRSFIVSAKTGDNIRTAFLRIAADLAGVTLDQTHLEAATKVLKADIVNHVRNDPQQKELVLEEKKRRCALQ